MMVLILKHQTREQFLARLRAASAEREGADLVPVARWVTLALDRGVIDAQELATAYGHRASKESDPTAEMVARMRTLADADDTVRAAKGE
jgi:hypothetical protein